MKTLTTLALVAACLASAPTIQAQSITSTNGTTVNYSDIEANITGNMMGGMKVSATFANGTSLFGLWNDLGGGQWGVDLFSGQVHYIKVSLGATSNTFNSDWRVDLYQTTDIQTLTFEGGPNYGNVLFDLPSADPLSAALCQIFGVGYPANQNGCRGQTTGSSTGNAYNVSGSTFNNADATYTNITQRGADPLQYDSYSKVSVSFNDMSGDGPDNDQSPFYFKMDTDKGIPSAADISTVPEPSTYMLMATGLAAMGAFARRRRRNTLSA